MLFASLLFAPIVAMRPRLALCILVFALAFLPRYIGVGVSDEGFALTPRRLLVVATAIGIILHLFLRPGAANTAAAVVRQAPSLFLLVAGVYVAKLVATVSNSGLGLNLFYVFDDAALALVPALAVLLFVRSSRDEVLVVQALVLALVVSACLAIIESMRGTVLLQGLVTVTVEEAGRGGLTDLVRGQAYRAKALFDNPLLLAEFACIVAPWAAYLWSTGLTRWRRGIGLAGMLSAPVCIYLAHTRSGWLVFAMALATFGTIRLWDRSGRTARVPIGMLSGLALLFAAGASVHLIMNIESYLLPEMAGSRSILERLNQYVLVANALVESPLLGYGMTRNFAEDLEFLNNFDNYWLRLLLEGGLTLIFCFLALAAIAIVSTLALRSSAPTLEFRLFMTAALVCMQSFFLYKLFISMPTNNAYFFLALALVARRAYWHHRAESYARPALSQ